MAYPNRLLIGYSMYIQNCAARLVTSYNSKLRTYNTSSSWTTLATSQTTNYVPNTTSYVQNTEWYGAKIYSRSPSALYSDEAITIFKKSACNTKV